MYHTRYKRILVVHGSARGRAAVAHRHATTTHSVTLFSLRTLTPPRTAVARACANSCESRVSSTDVARIVRRARNAERNEVSSELAGSPFRWKFPPGRPDSSLAPRNENAARSIRKNRIHGGNVNGRTCSPGNEHGDFVRKYTHIICTASPSEAITVSVFEAGFLRLRNYLATSVRSSTNNIFLLAKVLLATFRTRAVAKITSPQKGTAFYRDQRQNKGTDSRRLRALDIVGKRSRGPRMVE